MKYWFKIVLLGFYLSLASTHYADTLIENIKAEFDGRIYPASSVLDGYKRPRSSATEFSVVDFRVNSPQFQKWSLGIAEILRYKIEYVPSVKLTMPSPFEVFLEAELKDKDSLLVDAKNFKQLYSNLGTETVLTGSLDINGNNFDFVTELISAANGEQIASRNWSFEKTALPDTLIEISKWVYLILGIELNAKEIQYIEKKNSLPLKAIEEFIELRADFDPKDLRSFADRSLRLHDEYPEFVLFAIFTMGHWPQTSNVNEYQEMLEMNSKMRNAFPEHAGVIFKSIVNTGVEMALDSKEKDVYADLKKLAIESPNDPRFIGYLAESLIQGGYQNEGFSVLLETIERWPNSYRTWSNLAGALNHQAWIVRGNEGWRDVPEKSQQKFQNLIELADLVNDRALEINPRSGPIWVQKLMTLGGKDGYSEELIETFERAVELVPNERRLYTVAMNYSLDQWGGKGSTRANIAKLARENNPDVYWPEDLMLKNVSPKDQMLADFNLKRLFEYIKEFFNEPQTWKIGILITVCFAFGKWLGGRKPKQVRVEADVYGDETDY